MNGSRFLVAVLENIRAVVLEQTVYAIKGHNEHHPVPHPTIRVHTR